MKLYIVENGLIHMLCSTLECEQREEKKILEPSASSYSHTEHMHMCSEASGQLNNKSERKKSERKYTSHFHYYPRAIQVEKKEKEKEVEEKSVV